MLLSFRIKLVLECTISYTGCLHAKGGLGFFYCFSSHFPKLSVCSAGEKTLINERLL